MTGERPVILNDVLSVRDELDHLRLEELCAIVEECQGTEEAIELYEEAYCVTSKREPPQGTLDCMQFVLDQIDHPKKVTFDVYMLVRRVAELAGAIAVRQACGSMRFYAELEQLEEAYQSLGERVKRTPPANSNTQCVVYGEMASIATAWHKRARAVESRRQLAAHDDNSALGT